MLQSVPSKPAGQRPRKIATFNCPTFIVIQVIGASTLYLAETDQQLMLSNDDGTIDALQLTQAGAPGGIYPLWWNGDLWANGSQAANANFRPFFGIPGPTTGSDPTQNGSPAVYGVTPSTATDGLGM